MKRWLALLLLAALAAACTRIVVLSPSPDAPSDTSSVLPDAPIGNDGSLDSPTALDAGTFD